MALGKINRHKKSVHSHLNIISMMDILVILVVFLLYNVSFDEQTKKSVSKGLVLPTSLSPKNYKDHKVIISMSMNDLRLNDESVLKLQNGVIPEAALDGEKILPLYAALEKLQDNLEAEGTKDGANDYTKSVVLFQADKRIAFKKLNPVMKTAGMAGFPNFWLAVMNKGS